MTLESEVRGMGGMRGDTGVRGQSNGRDGR